MKDGFFPADLVLLSSSHQDGISYVDTINLDGESNLKIKQALDQTRNLDEATLSTFKVLCLQQEKAFTRISLTSLGL